jgi:hypothetical protein
MLCFICHLPAASAFADKIGDARLLGKSKRRRSCPSGQLHGGDSFSLVDATQAIVCQYGSYRDYINVIAVT